MGSTCHQQRITKALRSKDTSAFYLWANMFGLPNLQLCANEQGEFVSPDFWPAILGMFFVLCDWSPWPHLCQIDFISVLRTGDILVIGWPSQPVSHPSFPVDARTGIAVGRRLRTAQDLRAANGGEVEGESLVCGKHNSTPPAKQDILG